MDETTLAYHTKLHQWYELHRLNRSGDMANLKLPEDGAHLTPQRAVEIDLWRKEVNKIFVKPKKVEKKSEFWRCHMSAPTSASKHYSISADPRRVKSARFLSSSRIKPNVLDMNTLPSHLAEMSIHYSQERNGIYNSGFTPEDLLIKGKKQELHLPQSFRAFTSPHSEEVMTKDGETHISIPRDIDTDLRTHAESGHDTIQPEKEVSRKAQVVDRSKSNDLLNVMSIDDCKMALRYRPQRVLNNCQQVVRINSAVSKDSEDLTAYQLRISQGSGITPISQAKINSVLSAQRLKHKQFVLNGNNLTPQRPQSAILARAFDTILQENSMLSTPLHPKEVRFLAGNKDWRHQPSGKHLYHRLNTTLKTKMNSVVNARWDNLRGKDSSSARVQYSNSGVDSNKFSKRSTATDSLISDDAKQL